MTNYYLYGQRRNFEYTISVNDVMLAKQTGCGAPGCRFNFEITDVFLTKKESNPVRHERYGCSVKIMTEKETSKSLLPDNLTMRLSKIWKAHFMHQLSMIDNSTIQ